VGVGGGVGGVVGTGVERCGGGVPRGLVAVAVVLAAGGAEPAVVVE
jgi:hypothetical protein